MRRLAWTERDGPSCYANNNTVVKLCLKLSVSCANALFMLQRIVIF